MGNAIDRAMEGLGMAMGPFRMSDLAGNDIGWAIQTKRAENPALGLFAFRICEAGRFGQKTGAGCTDYISVTVTHASRVGGGHARRRTARPAAWRSA